MNDPKPSSQSREPAHVTALKRWLETGKPEGGLLPAEHLAAAVSDSQGRRAGSVSLLEFLTLSLWARLGVVEVEVVAWRTKTLAAACLAAAGLGGTLWIRQQQSNVEASLDSKAQEAAFDRAQLMVGVTAPRVSEAPEIEALGLKGLNDKARRAIASHALRSWPALIPAERAFLLVDGRLATVSGSEVTFRDSLNDPGLAVPARFEISSSAVDDHRLRLAVGGTNGDVLVWEFSDISEVGRKSEIPPADKIPPAEKGNVKSLLFSPSGETLLVGHPESLLVYQRAPDSWRPHPQHPKFPWTADSMALNANRLAFVEGNQVQIRILSARSQPKPIEISLGRVALSADDRWLAVAGMRKKDWVILLHEQKVAEESFQFGDAAIHEIVFLGDEYLLVRFQDHVRVLSLADRQWKHCGLGNLGLAETGRIPTDVGMAIPPSSKDAFLTFRSDGTTALWSAASGRLERYISPGHSGEIHWATFSADGSRFLTGGSDRYLRDWRLEVDEAAVDAVLRSLGTIDEEVSK